LLFNNSGNLFRKPDKKINTNFAKYINERLLTKREFKEIIFKTYLNNHEESLKVAEDLFKKKSSSLWTIVTSYYSMFYIANAIIFKLGYKVGDKIAHKITADALIVLTRNKLKQSIIESYEKASEEALELSDNLLESFDYERNKRSRIQYHTTEAIKQNKAETSLNRARLFAFEIKKLFASANKVIKQ